MNVDYKLIGERIKKTRKLNGITQDVLAEKLGVSIGYVSQVERGITKISLDLLGAISSILECDIASFITESVTNSSEYMESELLSEIRKLDGKKKVEKVKRWQFFLKGQENQSRELKMEVQKRVLQCFLLEQEHRLYL